MIPLHFLLSLLALAVVLNQVPADSCGGAHVPTAQKVNITASEKSKFDAVEQYLNEQFENQRKWGAVGLRTQHKNVLTYARGYANYHHHAPMKLDTVFQTGSNAKLYTAVALYQLQEKSLVNLSEPVSNYLDNHDFKAFGIPDQSVWCPKMMNDTSGECQDVTFVQLLAMTSGFPNSLNCDNLPPDSPYCLDLNTFRLPYQGSIGHYVGMFINFPLVYRPGSKFSYSNMNYILASYMVEKLSGMSFQTYLQQNIFEPAGLRNTYYDPYDGKYSIIPGLVDTYQHFYTNATQEFLSTGTCRPYFARGTSSGSGGIVSTIEDLMTWYEVLFADPDNSPVLSRESINQVIRPHSVMDENFYFGQGSIVEYHDTSSSWPSSLVYCGGMLCTVTCIRMVFHAHIDEEREYTIVSDFSSAIHLSVNGDDAQDEVVNQVSSNIEMSKLLSIWSEVEEEDQQSAERFTQEATRAL